MASDKRTGHTITSIDLWGSTATAQIPERTATPEQIHKTLDEVILALNERGYDPVDQLVGYFITGEPAYITSHNDARTKISTIGRDILLAGIIKCYMLYTEDSNGDKNA